MNEHERRQHETIGARSAHDGDAKVSRKLFSLLLISLLALLVLALKPWEIAKDRVSAELEPVASEGTRFPTTYHVSRDVGTLDTGMRDVNGRHIGATCNTCHEQHAEAPFAEREDQLKEFHTGLRFAHGDQTCSTCHVQEARDKLRLADGRQLDFAEVMTLCSQCHGPQARDYRNGSHGGMNGYWDLTRGPRTRNSCTDCHNPHMPAYPQVMPVFPPKDRFLEGTAHE